MMDFPFYWKNFKKINVWSFLELGTTIARTSIEVAKLDPRMRVVTIERNSEMIVQAKRTLKKVVYPIKSH